jgi:hypothetical protein
LWRKSPAVLARAFDLTALSRLFSPSKSYYGNSFRSAHPSRSCLTLVLLQAYSRIIDLRAPFCISFSFARLFIATLRCVCALNKRALCGSGTAILSRPSRTLCQGTHTRSYLRTHSLQHTISAWASNKQTNKQALSGSGHAFGDVTLVLHILIDLELIFPWTVVSAPWESSKTDVDPLFAVPGRLSHSSGHEGAAVDYSMRPRDVRAHSLLLVRFICPCQARCFCLRAFFCALLRVRRVTSACVLFFEFCYVSAALLLPVCCYVTCQGHHMLTVCHSLLPPT